MSTWTKIYINTADKDRAIEQLKLLSGITEINTSGGYPKDLYESYLSDEKAIPTYLAIGMTEPNWVTVSHNSFNKLSEWAIQISKNLATKIIVTIAQSVSDVYYFSLFDKGQKIREIEVCYSDDFKPKNFGKPFDFENEQPGSKQEYDGEVEYYFGFEEIEEYCRHFGLDIQADLEMDSWSILRNTIKTKSIHDFVNTELIKEKKPWWRFW